MQPDGRDDDPGDEPRWSWPAAALLILLASLLGWATFAVLLRRLLS